jgi:exodeoxyribonuclease V beta subunit
MKRLDAATVSLDGIHLVEASAGTGKTYAITSLYLRAVVELGLLPEKILVVTFTRAATAELRERIRARLRSAQSELRTLIEAFERGEEILPTDPCLQTIAQSESSLRLAVARLENSLLVIDEAAVMTIHGFCARVLEGNAFESKMALSVEMIETVDDLVEEVIVDFAVSRLSELSSLKLPLYRRYGLTLSELRLLAKTFLSTPHVRILPEVQKVGVAFETALRNLELNRSLTRAWLNDPAHELDLSSLQKTKRGEGLGSRLIGTLEKARIWLSCPIAELESRAEEFDKLRELAAKNPGKHTAALLQFFELLDRCDLAYDDLDAVVQREVLVLRRDFLEFLTHELEGRKAARRIQSYEDLLSRLRSALTGDGGEILAETLRTKYPVSLIDEFQDTDPIQYDVFSRIYATQSCMFMIGDPKQSIYAFRGADVDNYLRAASLVGNRRHTLEVNYRSDPALISGLERLFFEHPDPFCGAGIEFVRVKSRADAINRCESGFAKSGLSLIWLETRDIASEAGLYKYQVQSLALKETVISVRRLLGSVSTTKRRIRPSDITVLTRTNRECGLVARALNRAGIRCLTTSDGSVLEGEAATSLVCLFQALIQPGDLRALATLLMDPLVGLAPKAVTELMADESELDEWIERLSGYERIAVRAGILTVLYRLIDELGVKDRLLPMPGGERFVTDVVHVAELVQTAALRARLGLDGQLRWLERARVDVEQCAVEERQLRVESDAEAVSITTVHRSKGLQYPYVICPFLWSERSKTRKRTVVSYRRRLDSVSGSERIIHLMPSMLEKDGLEFEGERAEQLAETARLIYVALTRAKHQAILLVGPIKGLAETALGRLLFLRGQSALLDNVKEGLPFLNRELKCDALSVEGVDAIAEEPELPLEEVVDESEQSRLFEPRLLRRIVVPSVHTTSYSALTVHSGEARTHQNSTVPAVTFGLGPDLGRDIDALTFSSVTLVDLKPENADMRLEPDERLRRAGFESLPFSELPNGPKTGEALHALYEELDFETYNASVDTPDIKDIFHRFGINVRADVDEGLIRQAIAGVLDVPFIENRPTLTLRNVPKSKRLNELEFLLELPSLNVDTLASLLGPEITGMPPEYVEHLRKLNFEPVTGFLRGFIDLIFEFEGRYFVVDYKSNYLGKSAKDYAGESLRVAMMAHHYPVQAALYAVATDRWLRCSLSGYDYERHFGGVAYLFLRGMHPSLDPGSGVFFHRPNLEAMQRWDVGLRGEAS